MVFKKVRSLYFNGVIMALLDHVTYLPIRNVFAKHTQSAKLQG